MANIYSVSYNNITNELSVVANSEITHIVIGYSSEFNIGYFSQNTATTESINSYPGSNFNIQFNTITQSPQKLTYSLEINLSQSQLFSNSTNIGTITNKTNWISSLVNVNYIMTNAGTTISTGYVQYNNICQNTCFSGDNCNILSNTCEMVCGNAMTKCSSGTFRNSTDQKCYPPCNNTSVFTQLMASGYNGTAFDPSEITNYANYDWPNNCGTLSNGYTYQLDPNTNKYISVQECPSSSQMRFSSGEIGVLKGVTQNGDNNCYNMCPSGMGGFPDCNITLQGYTVINGKQYANCPSGQFINTTTSTCTTTCPYMFYNPQNTTQ